MAACHGQTQSSVINTSIDSVQYEEVFTPGQMVRDRARVWAFSGVLPRCSVAPSSETRQR